MRGDTRHGGILERSRIPTTALVLYARSLIRSLSKPARRHSGTTTAAEPFPNLCHSSDKEATLESARIAIGLLDGSQIETVLLTKSGIQQKSPAPILFKGRRESFDIEALPWLRWLVPSDPRARHRLTVAST